MGEERHLPAQDDEASARVSDALAVVVAEVGDGLEVGCQAPGEPHEFDVALRLALQPTARLDAIEVAVDVQLEQDRGVVSRATGGRWIGAFEPKRLEVQLVDECIDDAHRVVFANVVVKAFWQQRDLVSVRAFDESLHGLPC